MLSHRPAQPFKPVLMQGENGRHGCRDARGMGLLLTLYCLHSLRHVCAAASANAAARRISVVRPGWGCAAAPVSLMAHHGTP